MQKRNILLNPGPATTTESVKLAQVVPDICPREKEFGDIMRQIGQDLVRIVHGDADKYTAVLFCGSGTISMDVCINSLVPADKKILIINNGTYSSRAAEICSYYRLDCIDMTFPVDECPDLDQIKVMLQEEPEIAVVYATHHETGTGLLNPIRDIGALTHEYGCTFIVDTTSTYAMLPFDIEEYNIDFCMASAQKGLMSMTGLSFVIGNRKLIEESADFPKRSYYCNLYMQYRCFEKTGEMHFTPPVQTAYATRQAITEYFAEGEKEKWERHRRVHAALRKGMLDLGFKEFIKPQLQSELVETLIYPDDENWNFEKIHDYCYERGFTIYPGKLSELKVFRLCSLGAIDVADVENFLEVFPESLAVNQVSIPIQYQ